MTEDVESDCCCRGFWFWAAIIFAFLTVLWNIRGPGYYVKVIFLFIQFGENNAYKVESE